MTTVAGVSRPTKFREQRQGGYRDGRANVAQFNRPSGIAVARDGTIYVADEINRSIRKISRGVVSTFASGFNFPRAVAVDDSGNVYVADFGIGLRKITPKGQRSDLGYPNDSGVSGIAAKGTGKNLILAYTDRTSIHMIVHGQHIAADFTADREPLGQGYQIGFAFGVAILSQDSVVITDPRSHAVRFVRLTSLPLTPTYMTRGLIGGLREGQVPTGGFEDGSTDRALAFSPYGVTAAPDGNIYVTDQGNRRIRKISGLESRNVVYGDLSNLPFGPNRYRIALIGPSYEYMNVLWPESFGGALEAGLARDAKELHLPRAPEVKIIRSDGADFSILRSFISSYLADGHADAVVMFVDKLTLEHEVDHRPDLKAGDHWKAVLPAELRTLQRQLGRAHTRLFVAVVPSAEDVSPTERDWHTEIIGAAFYDRVALHAAADAFERTIASSGVPTLRMLAPMEKSELGEKRTPLFYGDDSHLTIDGSKWVGSFLLGEFERLKPWLAMRKTVKSRPARANSH